MHKELEQPFNYGRQKEDQRQVEDEQEHHLSYQPYIPLPRRRTPWPWEDLASLVSRTAEAMGYLSPDWILHPQSIRYKIAAKDLLFPSGQDCHPMLGRLLGLDEATLRTLTIHRFTIGQVERPASAQRRIRDIEPLFRSFKKTTQVCPCCLDEPKSYDRLYWRIAPLLLCPRHHVFLIRSCPSCQRPISAPRLNLVTCRFCGGDYRQQIVPLHPDAAWLLNTNVTLLRKLGVDAGECGEPLISDEPTILQNLTPPEYLWITTKFLALFEGYFYRRELLPFLMCSLPVTALIPDAPQNPYLILHYLLSSWPVHWWVLLERLLHAMEYDLPSQQALRYYKLQWGEIRDTATSHWEKLLEQGDCWQQEISKERTLTLLHSFFDAVESFFQQGKNLGSPPIGERIIASEVFLAHQLRSAESELENPVHPYPWEDLASVLSRLARHVGYEDPARLLISEIPPRRKISSLEVPLLHEADDYRFLKRRLGLDERTLYQLTLHRFATRLQPSGEDEAGIGGEKTFTEQQTPPLLTRKTLWQYCTTLRHTKICPVCVDDEAGFDRLYWRLRPMVFCPVHLLLLTNCCPHCRAPIPGLRPVFTQCPYCQRGDYRRSSRAFVPSTSPLCTGQALLLHELTSEHVSYGEGPAAFSGSPILLLKPWEYFTLWERFGEIQWHASQSTVFQALVQLAWNEYPITRDSPVAEREAKQSACFHFLLASWPENLLTLLHHVATQSLSYQGRRGLSQHFWQFDQLVQHLWSTLAYNTTSFDFLSHLFETLRTWATLSDL